jgi:hypothetical protein
MYAVLKGPPIAGFEALNGLSRRHRQYHITVIESGVPDV